MEKREEFLLNLFFYIFILILICLSNNSFSQNQTINNFSKSKTLARLEKLENIALKIQTSSDVISVATKD